MNTKLSKNILLLGNVIIWIIEVCIALRVVLKFLAANPLTPFVAWIYNLTDVLLGPFAGIFPSLNLYGRSVLEFSAIVGLIAYGILGYFFDKVIDFLTTQIDRPVVKSTNRVNTTQTTQTTPPTTTQETTTTTTPQI